jgi:hypothetical protein
MGQIVVGDGQVPSIAQELVMNLHRSDQEVNVRMIEAALAAAGAQALAGSAQAAEIETLKARIVTLEGTEAELRDALENALTLATEQGAVIAEQTAKLAGVNDIVDTPGRAAVPPVEIVNNTSDSGVAAAVDKVD